MREKYSSISRKPVHSCVSSEDISNATFCDTYSLALIKYLSRRTKDPLRITLLDILHTKRVDARSRIENACHLRLLSDLDSLKLSMLFIEKFPITLHNGEVAAYSAKLHGIFRDIIEGKAQHDVAELCNELQNFMLNDKLSRHEKLYLHAYKLLFTVDFYLMPDCVLGIACDLHSLDLQEREELSHKYLQYFCDFVQENNL